MPKEQTLEVEQWQALALVLQAALSHAVLAQGPQLRPQELDAMARSHVDFAITTLACCTDREIEANKANLTELMKKLITA